MRLNPIYRLWSVGFLVVMIFAVAHAQVVTVGTIFGEHEGYTLLRPLISKVIYLIDDEGHLIHSWEVSSPGNDAFLRENGNLVVTTARQTPISEEEDFTSVMTFTRNDGRFEEYTWDGELVWEYEFNRPFYRVHHGITVMPNGNILFIAWEYISNEEAIAAGRDPDLLGDGLWSDVFLEYDPQLDEIVWEWHVWDHIVQDFDATKENYGVIAENPHLVDVNFFEPQQRIEDWIHSNSIGYNPELDQIAISAREQNEVWIVDHSITTEEARGEAGDLLYRWGNPRAYDSGDEDDRHIFYQHDVQWVPEGYPGAGNIILFSNRHTLTFMSGETVQYSAIVEFTPPVQEDGTYAKVEGEAFAPAEPTWVYTGFPDNAFISSFISGVQRLPNGNTLVTKGASANLFEVTPQGEIVWFYVPPFQLDSPVPPGSTFTTAVFRTRRYQADYPAFEGRDLTPSMRIEDMAGMSQDMLADVRVDDAIFGFLNEDIPDRYYRLQPVQNSVIDISMESDSLDAHLTLTDSSWQPLISNDNSDGQNARLTYPVSIEYTYYIIATDSSDDAAITGDFTLRVDNEGDLFVNIAPSIPRIVYGTSIPDVISSEDTESYYAFWGYAGDQISITMTRNNGTLLPLVALMDAEESVLVEAHAEGESTEAMIESFELPATGVYLIHATRYEGDDAATNTVGAFNMLLEQDDAP